MSFVDDLLSAAKAFPQVKRLYISTWEIKTDPHEARDGSPNGGWPAAWAIARKAHVSGGAGNTGQHSISVSADAKRAAFPPEYTEWLAKKAVAEGAHSDAQWALEDALQRVRLEAERQFLGTDEAKELQQRVSRREQDVNALYADCVPAPAWLTGGWYEVQP